MDIKELVLKNRSYRRFDERRRIEEKELIELIELGRLCPSGANLQPLKFVPVCDPKRLKSVFETLAWAGYLEDWDGPGEGERPTGYVIIIRDRTISKGETVDHGIAAQTILLGAVDKGLGGCMIASVDKEELRERIGIGSRYEILLVIALGMPVEKVRLEPVSEGDIRYYRDHDGVHHVPKRSMDELLVRPYWVQNK